MTQRWTPERIRALREMSNEFLELLRGGDPEDPARQEGLDWLGGMLAGVVPDLLDEIERLQAGRPAAPERAHMVKLDRAGGVA